MLPLRKENLMCGGLAMRKIVSALGLTAILVASTTAYADTIYLKNGSIIKGKVSSFADDQFVVILNTGSASRATIYYADISRIEFDSAGASADVGTPPRDTVRDTVRDTPRDTTSSGASRQVVSDTAPARDNPPDAPPRSGGSSPATDAGSQPPESAKPVPPAGDSESTPSSSRKSGAGRSTNVDVIAKRDWTST